MKKSLIAVGISFGLALGGVAQAQDESSAEAAEETEATGDSDASEDSDAADEDTAEPMTAPADESMESGGGSEHSQIAVTFNPLGLIFGLYSGEIGYALSDKLSVNVTGSYFNLDVGFVDVTAYGVGIGIQYFLSGHTFHGWYVAPSVNYASATGEALLGIETTASALTARAVGGYQWDWQPFVLRLGLGADYSIQLNKVGNSDVGFDGTGVAADASIGFSF